MRVHLYLTCAKFVTTPAYAPCLRARRLRELEQAAASSARGWPREVERHRRTVARIEQLLTELRQPVEGRAARPVEHDVPGQRAEPNDAKCRR